MGICCWKRRLTNADSTLIGDKMSFCVLALLDPLKPMKLK